MNINKILIDGDTLVYTSGFAAQSGGKTDFPVSHSKHCLMGLMKTQFKHLEEVLGKEINIKDWLISGRLKIYLTSNDRSNFRFAIAKTLPYKANREGKPKPLHYLELREWLIDKWNAIVVTDMEADDAIGLEASKDPFHTLAWHKDKDINQVSCWHGWYESKAKYNKKLYFVEPLGDLRLERTTGGKLELNCTGQYLLWYQMLCGDSSDNIPPLAKGFGPIKCYEILKSVKPLDLRAYIHQMYFDIFGNDDRFNEILQLVTIKQD